jgi:hypothetical protein
VLGRANVGDVGHPFGIGGGGREVAFQMIASPSRWDTRGLLPPTPPLRHALQAGPAHQARHPVTATPLTSVA